MGDVSKSDVENWLLLIEEIYRKKQHLKQFKQEKDALRSYLYAIEQQFNKNESSFCKLTVPYRVGGTGIVFKAIHNSLPDQELAFKFNRPLIESDEMSQVENERRILPYMNHPNIIRVYSVGEIQVPTVRQRLSYIIEPFVPGVRTVGDYVSDLSKEMSEFLEKKDKAINNTIADQFLNEIVSVLRQWVTALLYIHQKGYLYLDIKPDNVMVSALVPEPTVYFDDRFGHPDLKNEAEYRSPSRVMKALRRKDIRPEFDLFALGKSILSLLRVVAEDYPHDLPQRPLFRSLHFLATRLLDGKNEENEPLGTIAAETFGCLTRNDYKSIKYSKLEHVLRDIEKENGAWNIEERVPELATYSKDVVRVITGTNTVLTDRLKAIIEHPLVSRLKAVSQLGLVSLVYPTADHSRFDHSLGTFTYTASYVKSLFQDTQNPIFRNLVDETDIKAVLLASLLHDLGQYPLAHDLGEIHELIFKHTNLTESLLSDPSTDKYNRTLLDIIQGIDEHNAWAVDANCLRRILKLSTTGKSEKTYVPSYSPAKSDDILQLSNRQSKLFDERDSGRDFKAEMLSAVIDGPIDADKADYIIRDSEQCRVPYGHQLDIERLLRVLTTVRLRGDERNNITIGVYEKGRASAESFAFARYLMHSSIYWHHTSRVIKTMVQYGVALGLPCEVFLATPVGAGKIEGLKQNLLYFIKHLTPPFIDMSTVSSVSSESRPRQQNSEKQSLEKNPSSEVYEQVVGSRIKEAGDKKINKQDTKWVPGVCPTDGMMLDWLNLGSNSSEGKALIESIQKRDLYKRVCTISRERNGDLVTRLEKLNWPGRIDLCRKVQGKIYSRILEKGPPKGTRPLESQDEVGKHFTQELAIIIDIPDREKLIKDRRPLVYVPELQRKTYFQETQDPIKAEQFMNSIEALLGTIAPIRVLCHPHVRQAVSFSSTQSEIIGDICNASNQVF
ncbi:MAG: HD domain-containing protein [Candidatus Bathyarchaeota archaeon]|nr:HD domain-containing protein [Candidatus Bathyarchaeota archaeon]